MKRNEVFLQKEMQYPIADTIIRIIAYVIDLLILWSIRQIFVIPVLSLLHLNQTKVIFNAIHVQDIVTGIIFFVYFVLMTYFFNQTAGKMIMGIRVVSDKGYQPSFGQIFFREVIGRYLTQALLNLPYLMILFNKNRMGLHDFIGDTFVVNAKDIEYNGDGTENMDKDSMVRKVDSDYGNNYI